MNTINGMNNFAFIFTIMVIATFSPRYADNKQTSTKSTSVFYFNSIDTLINPFTTPSQIPVEFIPENSEIQYLIKLRSDKGFFHDIQEITVILKNSKSMESLLSYYETIIPGIDWKILQKEKINNANMILAEGNGKTNMTVILSENGNFRKIKLFYKKPSIFD